MREVFMIFLLHVIVRCTTIQRNLQTQKEDQPLPEQRPAFPILIYPLTPSTPTTKLESKLSQQSIKYEEVTPPIIPADKGPSIHIPQDTYFKQVIQKITQYKKPRYDLPFYCSTYRNMSEIPKYDGSTREKLVLTNYNFTMYVDARDLTVSSVITSGGTWEPGYIQLMGRLVKEGDSVLNLGSQSGLEALVLGKIVGPKGKVFVFQPYSFSNFLVTKNFEINNMSSYTKIFKVGASDQKQKAIIKVSYWNTGGSQIHKPKNNTKYIFELNNSNTSMQNQSSKSSQEQSKTQQAPLNNPFRIQLFDYPSDETQQIQTDLVDNLLPQDVSLNFALLDVEKMEIKTLRGMRNVIERSPNLIIMTQWQYAGNISHNRETTVQFLLWIISKKYRIYSYQIGDTNDCVLGRFRELTDQIEQILNINFADLFFFPAHIRLPAS